MFVCPIKNSYCGFVVGSNLPSPSSHWFRLTDTNPLCVTPNAQNNGTIKAVNYAPTNATGHFFLVFGALLRYVTAKSKSAKHTVASNFRIFGTTGFFFVEK